MLIFQKKAYVVVQIIDANLSRSEWPLYKKSLDKDEYAFNSYVRLFKDIWDNRSKEGVKRGVVIG